jgi:hypothetical protein
MKKICCPPGQLNKVLDGLKPKKRFIRVHLVHLYGQHTDLSGFPMNQMNLDVLVCCLWQKVCYGINWTLGAMNLEMRHFIEVHWI